MAFLLFSFWLLLAASAALWIALSRRLAHWTKVRKAQWVYQIWVFGWIPLAVQVPEMEGLSSWPYVLRWILSVVAGIVMAAGMTMLTGMLSKRLTHR